MRNNTPRFSPFKLLRAYEKEDVHYYFGRDKETRQLYDALIRSKFMMVYGASGTGKTSLIQCGLQSMFSPRDWMPVLIRRQENFLQSIHDELYRRYLEYFAVRQKQEADWYPDEPAAEPETFDSLRDLIKALFNLSYIPVYLILDQFEEIFTLGDRTEQDEFFAAIKELELFSEDLFCKVILVTREEYIAHFYHYENALPFLFENRFRVEKIREEQLLQVVAGILTTPYKNYPEFKLDAAAPALILQTLTDEKGEVDLTTLQVYLDRLYQEDRQRATERDHILIDEPLVKENQLDDVLADFLDRQVERVSEQLHQRHPVKHEDGAQSALQVLFQMVTSQGTKQNRNAEEIFHEIQLGKSSVTLPFVQECLNEFASQESRILNRLRFAKTNDERFEIMHDRLAERIFSKFGADELRRREATITIRNKRKRFLEAQEKEGRKPEYLSIGEIALVEQSLNTERLEKELKDFFTESQLFHERRAAKKRRQFRLAIAASIVFALVAAAAVLLFFRAKAAEEKAVHQAKLARASQLASMSQAELAKHKRHESLLLAAEAYHILPDDPPNIVLNAIFESYCLGFQQSVPLFKAAGVGHQHVVFFANFSPDGQQIISVSKDSTAKVWDLDGHILHDLKHDGIMRWAQFSLDGQKIITASNDGVVNVWDRDANLLTTFKGYDQTLIIALLSPDGNIIVTSYLNGAVKSWSLDGEPVANFEGHGNMVSSLAFSPDGTKILTASVDATARLWDLNGKELVSFRHVRRVHDAQFSPDGTKILTGSEDKTAILWDTRGNELRRFEHHASDVRHVAFSPDGTQFLTASYDGTAVLMNLDGSFSKVMHHIDGVRMANFSPDGKYILTVSRDYKAKTWDLEGNLMAELNQHKQWLNSGQFSPDGRHIAIASLDSTITIWDLQGGLFGNINTHRLEVVKGNFSPDGQQVVTASWDGTAIIADVNGSALATLNHQGEVISAEFSHDGQQVLTGSIDGTAKIWTKDGTLTKTLTGHQDELVSAVFSPNDQYILTASRDQTARLWNDKGDSLAIFKGHEAFLTTAIFSPDGKQLLTTSEDNTAKLWDTNGNHLQEFEHENFVANAQFSPDGKNILTLSYDGTAKIWNLDGVLTDSFPHPGAILNGRFSPDGLRVLTASEDNAARLWDRRGNLLATFRHTSLVRTANFSPDGKFILTASEDQTATIWDQQGEEIYKFPWHQAGVNQAIFSNDGRRVLSISNDRTAKIWPMPSLVVDWVAEKNIVPFSEEEKERYGVDNKKE